MVYYGAADMQTGIVLLVVSINPDSQNQVYIEEVEKTLADWRTKYKVRRIERESYIAVQRGEVLRMVGSAQ